MTKSYEELVGGLGRAVRYRPRRYRVRDLLLDYPPDLVVGAEHYRLVDLAMSGLSFTAKPHEGQFDVGGVHDIDLHLVGEPIYSGRARVVRIEHSKDRVQVALQLLRGFIDVPHLVDRHDSLLLAQQLGDGFDTARRLVPRPYRERVEELAHFVQFHRAALERHEVRIRHRAASVEEALQDLAARASDEMRGRWFELRDAAADASLPHLDHVPTMQAMKRYSEQMLTRSVLDAPFPRRAYEKPLGYPGDYGTMMHIYRDTYEGETVPGKVWNKLGVEEPLAAGVRTRKDFIRDVTLQEHARVLELPGETEGFQVMSVGCGPALEVQEFATQPDGWKGHVSWLLVDQEEEALSLAYSGAYQAIAGATGAGDVQCLYVTFRKFIHDQEMVRETGRRHFVYSVGLFDYLRTEIARELVRVLVDVTEPGGLVAIGNACTHPRNFWYPEFMLDWTLIYRTKEDMVALASLVQDRVDVEVVLEPSEAYWFLLLRKRA